MAKPLPSDTYVTMSEGFLLSLSYRILISNPRMFVDIVFGPGVDIDKNSPDFQGLMTVVES